MNTVKLNTEAEEIKVVEQGDLILFNLGWRMVVKVAHTPTEGGCMQHEGFCLINLDNGQWASYPHDTLEGLTEFILKHKLIRMISGVNHLRGVEINIKRGTENEKA